MNKLATARPEYDLFKAIEEQQVMNRYLTEVKQLANATENKSRAIPYSPYDTQYILANGGSLGYMVSQMGRTDPSRNAFRYIPGITKVIPERLIKASLAHELGHQVLNHPASRPWEDAQWMEFEADAFAARLGFGQELIDYLWDYIPDSNDIPSNTHPTRQERADAIKEVMEHAHAIA